MSEYTFYLFSNERTKLNLTLEDAIKEYKNLKTTKYKALGVTKDDTYSCDLVHNQGGINNTNMISNDCLESENFKEDKLVTVNTINILKREILDKEKNYKIGIILPDFCDQGYLRDRDLNINAESEKDAIEVFKEYAFKYYLNEDEVRAVKRGQIEIGVIK